MKNFSRYLSKENGYFLVTTFIIMTILLVMGAVVLRISLAEYKQAEMDKNRIKAYYLARSGADLTADAMLEKGDLTLGEVDFNITKGSDDRISQVEVKPAASGSGYKIHSTAEVNSVSETAILTITKVSIFDFAAYTKDGFTFETLGKIIGDVGTGGTEEGEETKIETGFTVVNEEGEEVEIQYEYEHDPPLPEIEDLGFPEEPSSYDDTLQISDPNLGSDFTYDSSTDSYVIAVENIELGEGEEMEFIVGDKDIHLFVENGVKLESNACISITEETATSTGRLILHTNNFKTEEYASTEPEVENSTYDPNKFLLVETESAADNLVDDDAIDYKIETNSTFYGYIYAPSLDVQIETVGGLEGAVITKTLTMEDENTILDYSSMDSNDNFSTYARGKWEK